MDADGAGTDLRAQAERMTEICSRYRLTSDPVIAFDPEQREQLWKARKALYPTPLSIRSQEEAHQLLSRRGGAG